MRPLSVFEVSKEIYGIFNLYYRLHGVRITLFDAQGKKLYPQEDQPDCEYCRLVRQDLGKLIQCQKLDQRMIHVSMKENRMISYRCHGGMQEAAMPLLVDGEPLGCIMLGQFRKEFLNRKDQDQPETSPYLEPWIQKFGDQRLEQAYQNTPIYRDDKIPVLLELYQVILDFITREKMIRHRDFDLIRPVLELLEKQHSAQPSLQDAAHMIGRSPSSVSRLFKNITGKSYQNWLIQFKLEQAESLMLQKTKRPLSEIAWELGYQDPLYFSRLFKKHRGSSPREWKKKQLNGEL